MPFIHTVLDQHAEEAGLLWLRRDFAVDQPHFKLEDLAAFDSRLDAHLDGLRIADANNADAVWKVCERELEWCEPGEVFPAAILALETGDSHRIQRVLDVAKASYENSRPLVSALGWLPDNQVSEQIDCLQLSDDACCRRVGIAACVTHGRDPGAPLAEAVEHADALLSARALRAVGELGRVDLLPGVREQLAATDQRCRFSAAWSVARLTGDDPAIEVLQDVVQQGLPDAERALQMVLRVMQPHQAVSWSGLLTRDEETARLGVRGIGITGLPSVPVLLDIMASPDLARVAGEAFSLITGVDLAYQNLEGEWPEGFEVGPNDDPEDENVEMDPDENLPWPHVEKLKNWWSQHQNEFEPGQRYLCGQPLTEAWLQHVLRHGYQRQRAAAALELAIRNPGQPLFNVRAPGHRQQRLLGLK